MASVMQDDDLNERLIGVHNEVERRKHENKNKHELFGRRDDRPISFEIRYSNKGDLGRHQVLHHGPN